MIKTEMFTDPVVGKDFFGRADILQLLLKRASGLSQGYRQNVAVLGPELIGKSSLLQQLMVRFDDPKTVVVYVELRPRESYAEFASRVVAIFLHAVLKKVSKDSIASGEAQLQALRAYAPNTAAWLKAALERRPKLPPTENFIVLLELLSHIWKETGRHIVFILDEFDRLLEFGIEEPFAHLGKQIMVQKETMYLLASSRVSLARMILRQRLSLLFGHFEIIDLMPFSPDCAMDYLEKRWGLGTLEPVVKQFLIYLTGGHPFYLNVLGEQLAACSPVELRQASKKNVVGALEKVLFNAQGILNQYFTMRFAHVHSMDPSGKSQTILRSLAKRAYTSQEIYGLFKKEKVSQKLNQLLNDGLLEKNGVFYRLRDRLFAFWLKACYERKADVLSGNISEQSSEFRHEAEEAVARFSESGKKDLHQTMVELFSAFRGEMVEIDQKSHRLPQFSKIHHANGRNGTMTLIGQKENGSWIGGFYQHRITEEDITDFLNQCTQQKLPVHQRILVPLAGMDENARLLAKKERLWTWELDHVNMLLDVFGHGPIPPVKGGCYE
ncbi:MAG: ATP-binding protein [Candidatus Omnitrophota bacterium]